MRLHRLHAPACTHCLDSIGATSPAADSVPLPTLSHTLCGMHCHGLLLKLVSRGDGLHAELLSISWQLKVDLDDPIFAATQRTGTSLVTQRLGLGIGIATTS